MQTVPSEQSAPAYAQPCPSRHAQIYRDFDAAVDNWPCPRLAASTAAVWRRVRGWPTPSDRSRGEWHNELRHFLTAAAWDAECALGLASGIDFDAFIYQRILSQAFTLWRAEVRHAQRFPLYSPADFETDGGEAAVTIPEQEMPNPLCEKVQEKLALLAQQHRSLLELAFYQGRTQSEIATLRGLSQSQVSRRTKAALNSLRALLQDSLTLDA